MFNYKCQECGRGTVRPTRITNYQTKFDEEPFTVPEAVIGVCDICGARHFNAQEWKRWRRLFEEQREARVTTRITLPVTLHRKLQALKQTRQCSQSDIIAELLRQA